MPSTSKKQARTMAAAAHNPEFAKKVGIPVKVAKEFNKADKGRRFGSGGMALKPVDKDENPGLSKLPTDVRNKMGYMKKGGMAHSDVAKDKPMMKKVAKEEVKAHEKKMHAKKMAKGGSIDGCAVRGKTKGTMVKMYGGGKC